MIGAAVDLQPEQFFQISDEKQFNETALQVFRYQAGQNEVYNKYLSILNKKPEDVKSLTEIPFLPIEFFKTEKVITKHKTINFKPQIFTSSGTTGSEVSRHFVSEIGIYEKSFQKAFELFYGDVRSYCILALLPSYLEREGSSLVYMVDDLIKSSQNQNSGFYLNNLNDLHKTLLLQKENNENQG